MPQTLCVAGEACLPEMQLALYRTLPRLKVGALGPAAALFFGVAIARCSCTLRLSNGLRLVDLAPLRERDDLTESRRSLLSKLGVQTSDEEAENENVSDFLCLFGARHLNPVPIELPFSVRPGHPIAEELCFAFGGVCVLQTFELN